MATKHKILQVTASYYPSVAYGGPTVSIHNLCKALVASGQEVLVITTTANGKNELDVKTKEIQIVNGVPVIYFKRLSKDHTHFSPALLKYLWKNIHDFEIVHIHSWWNLVSVLSVIVCYLRRKKFVLSTRGTLNEFSFKKAFIRRAFIRLCNITCFRNAVFHVTSEKEYREVENAVKRDPVIIPNILSLEVANTIKKAHYPKMELIFLGRLHSIKNLNLLLDSLKYVDFDFNVNIIGDGEPDYVLHLKNLAIENHIEGKCIWFGAIHDETKKRELLVNADLLVLLSSTENFANVVIESLVAGTAVLLSSDIGLANYVHNNKLGWICRPEVDDIVAKLNEIYKSPNEIQRINREAPRLICRDFNEANLTEGYINLYFH